MTIIDAHNHPDWHGHDLPKFLGHENRYATTQDLSPFQP